MNWKFWKKQEYKRPKYYPKCVISYETYVDSAPEDRFISANWCCNKMKKFFDIDRLKIGGSKTYFPGTEGYTTYYCMGGELNGTPIFML
ncbi:hypothetical protein [Methanobrevibacter arboriphilus]|uniref:hypothetical protein n=1 Tax=Methanobrevibacter arboriphilus TaxID=39441 RepID=UPI0006D16D0C|nr:hypothetical protein [Methanobrevibacter arboriphilus]